ncbi:energy transducer TonB [Hymenobacter sp. 15J16-1T3B]|uniref:TonB family protein n=1 Tax=Hymenobacter sp. 15J16-1T3B TaxID=2886941 RepID=UPI001D10F1A8|nr:TonB family protein [Hymenobacter sp. 15J16-1T3B]MCC3157850.1 energy transducer TonB [Hymenobacter sp. 15J16-1T3B]
MHFRIILAGLTLAAATAQAQTAPAGDTVHVGGKVYTYVEQMPQPTGGMDALKQYLRQTLQYPPEALQQRIEGRVFVNFVVNVAGGIEQAKVLQNPDPRLGAEALRVVSQMPAWEPGRQNGRPVSVLYTLPVTFSLPPVTPALSGQRPAAEGQPARPVGGQRALEEFLKTALHYPEAARQAQASALVFVKLELDSLGQVGKTYVLTDMHQQAQRGADKKALRQAHEQMTAAAAEALRQPGLRWQPALRQGRPIKSSTIVPILFQGATGTAGVTPGLHLFPMVMPSVEGGVASLTKFLGQNIRYPVEALRGRTEGKLMVLFEVSEAGLVENPVVIQSVSPEIDAEALRVVAQLPPMFPALEEGKPVRSYLIVPLSFKIRTTVTRTGR